MKRTSAHATLGGAALLSLLLLAGCDDKPAAPPSPPPKVGVVTISEQPFTLVSQLPGRTAAYRVAEVRPQVDGIILKRLFEQGTDVKEGQQLYQIFPGMYEASLKKAEGDLLSARTLAERYKALVDEQAVSRQQYDTARANQMLAEAEVDQARINLRYTKVLAPISGRIGRTAITEGALATAGQSTALAQIQQIDPIYVDVVQSANDLLRLRRELESGDLEKVGDAAAKVSLLLPDGSAYAHNGSLKVSEVWVDETTGMVTLRAVFPNPEHVLLPGMFVQAQLLSGSKRAAILAPQQGVTRNLKGEPVAMVVGADNKVEPRVLTAERTVGKDWLISAGLKAGDRLITEGLQFIKPGVVVDPQPATNVQTAEPAAAAPAPAAGKAAPQPAPSR